jgi:hypothetical protein
VGHVRGVSDDDDRAVERAVFLNDAVQWLFARGHAADLILVVLMVEGVWLVRARGWPIAASALRLVPGALMIVALRAALTGAAWPWIALALAASFPAHLADLALGAPRRPARGDAINSPADKR